MAMGPHAEARPRRRHDDPLWVQRGEPGRVGFRRVRVRQHHVRGQDVLGQELHEAVPGRVREGPGHDHGAEVVQDVDLVGKDPLAGSPRAVQADAIRRGRPERSAPTPPDPAPPMFEILVLRPIEVPRRAAAPGLHGRTGPARVRPVPATIEPCSAGCPRTRARRRAGHRYRCRRRAKSSMCPAS